jgi:hypothetical protein
MRIIYSSNCKLFPLTYENCKGFSRKFAEKVFFPIDSKYLYFVTEGIHGADVGADGEPILDPGRSPNENGDFFFWHELIGESPIPGLKVYETWRDRNLLENHNPKNVRGEVVDSYPIAKRRSIDFLNALDRNQFPDLARKIEAGEITDTSMGVLVGNTQCSICKKTFFDTSNWCDHLRLFKGRKYPKTGELVYEISHEMIGIEDSVITVGAGADEDAKVRELLASKRERDMKKELSANRKLYKKYGEYVSFCSRKGIHPQEFEEFLEYITAK